MWANYTTLYVALDIGKNVNWVAAYEGMRLKTALEPTELLTDRRGFEKTIRLIDGLVHSGKYSRVVIGHEPTGIYHENWAHALHNHYAPHIEGQAAPAIEYHFIHTVSIKKKREALAKGRKRKSDPIDLVAIAHCLRDEQGTPAFLPTSQEFRFQLWASSYRQARRESYLLTVRLISQLDHLWPGAYVNLKKFRKAHPKLQEPVPLISTKPLERKRIQAILTYCPNPYDFLNFTVPEVLAFFRAHVGRYGLKTAQQAYNLVRNAVLPPPHIAEPLAERIRADFLRYRTVSERLKALEDEANDIVPGTLASILAEIPGISNFLAARYLAHIGNPERFENAAQVWAFAGFDPNTEGSGDTKRIGKISRKGDPDFRDTLYLIGLHSARNIPAIDRARRRALSNGKGNIGAVIHAAHKMNRICFHLLRNRIPFDPACLR